MIYPRLTPDHLAMNSAYLRSDTTALTIGREEAMLQHYMSWPLEIFADAMQGSPSTRGGMEPKPLGI